MAYKAYENLTSTTGSGIGRDCAIAFAAEGARGVAFADIDLPTAMAAADESRAKATNPAYRPIAVQVDVSSEESVHRMVDIVREEFGRIDYSVNSAGVSAPPSPLPPPKKKKGRVGGCVCGGPRFRVAPPMHFDRTGSDFDTLVM